MKVVILAGGLGTRLAEETEARPKPMVEIGGRPILWHIMKHYAAHGFDEFVVAARLQGRRRSSATSSTTRRSTAASAIDLGTGARRVRRAAAGEDWTVHLVDTGLDDEHRRARQAPATAGSATSTFMLTYGDGVCDVDLRRAARASTARTAGSRP